MEHFYQNLEGWFDYESLYQHVVQKYPSGSHFVEIGIFKGKSAAFMAVEILNSGKQIKFDCVDTWYGSPEHFSGESCEDKDVVDGKLYQKFLENMTPVKGLYTPVRTTSLLASRLYQDQTLDFVFIDAEHTYAAVKEDIAAWLPKIKRGGMIGGHDWVWPEVRNAIEDSLVDINSEGNYWWVYL